ncbi:MAG: hypothetical protein ACR2HH_02725 [Chthoniobacterales bacterium]
MKLLESELLQLRAELRKTLRAYSARLEIQLAQSVASIRADISVEKLPRERLHQLRDMTTMVRQRKVKPEKGRRKDLRAIDALISYGSAGQRLIVGSARFVNVGADDFPISASLDFSGADRPGRKSAGTRSGGERARVGGGRV